jgi:hypothetical protein
MIEVAKIDLGLVTRRDDPEGLGRVRIRVAGIAEPETPNWAKPFGIPGGGSAQRGAFEPPAVGSNVIVFFHRGDPDHPYYLPGPWGKPGGVSDVPTGAAVEGNDRQNAVTEDEEWLIERDSRAAAQTYRIRHKSSGAEIVIQGTDLIKLLRQTATEAYVLGTSYRAAEVLYLSGIHGALTTFASAMSTAANFVQIQAAGNALGSALGVLATSDIIGDPSAYLSTGIFGK